MTTVELTNEQAALIVGPDGVEVILPKVDESEEPISNSFILVAALGMLLADEEWIAEVLSIFDKEETKEDVLQLIPDIETKASELDRHHRWESWEVTWMTTFDVAAHNKRYLGLNDDQYNRHCELMGMKTTKWPDDLWEVVTETTQSIGVCGDVIACAVADWLKENFDK